MIFDIFLIQHSTVIIVIVKLVLSIIYSKILTLHRWEQDELYIHFNYNTNVDYYNIIWNVSWLMLKGLTKLLG